MAYIRPSFLLILLAFVVATAMTVSATDPDILTDYITPENSTIDGNFFTYTGMRGIFSYLTPTFNATKASVVEFPALNGQSVSLAVLKFPGGSINPLHTHPRASELLILIGGELEVGVVDTKNVLYTQVLQPGDIFVFPKGLVSLSVQSIEYTSQCYFCFWKCKCRDCFFAEDYLHKWN